MNLRETIIMNQLPPLKIVNDSTAEKYFLLPQVLGGRGGVNDLQDTMMDEAGWSTVGDASLFSNTE